MVEEEIAKVHWWPEMQRNVFGTEAAVDQALGVLLAVAAWALSVCLTIITELSVSTFAQKH